MPDINEQSRTVEVSCPDGQVFKVVLVSELAACEKRYATSRARYASMTNRAAHYRKAASEAVYLLTMPPPGSTERRPDLLEKAATQARDTLKDAFENAPEGASKFDYPAPLDSTRTCALCAHWETCKITSAQADVHRMIAGIKGADDTPWGTNDVERALAHACPAFTLLDKQSTAR